MSAPAPSPPTLWRTCRVLANRTRLHILHRVICKPDQSVSEIALQLKLTPATASAYLRALEARGFLAVRRSGRHARYRLGPASAQHPTATLIEALRKQLLEDTRPIETLFQLATAFTHPRRIEIFKLVNRRPQTADQIRDATGISLRALIRHLRKLERRGFLDRDRGRYWAVDRRNDFAKHLAAMAS